MSVSDALYEHSTNTINLNLARGNKDCILTSYVQSHIAQFDRLIKEFSLNYNFGSEFHSNNISSVSEATLKQCQDLIEAITLCFEIYFIQFILVTNDQLKYLVESWRFLKAKLDAKNSKDQSVDILNKNNDLIKNPHKLNYLVMKLLRVHKRRLDDELREKFAQIRIILAKAVDESCKQDKIAELDLFNLIDINELIMSINKRLNYFEVIGHDRIDQTKCLHEILFEEPNFFFKNKNKPLANRTNIDISEMTYKHTDFLSDTESYVIAKNKTLNKTLVTLQLKKWQKELNITCGFNLEFLEKFKSQEFHTDVEETEDDLSQVETNYSDSELDNMRINCYPSTSIPENILSLNSKTEIPRLQYSRKRTRKRKNIQVEAAKLSMNDSGDDSDLNDVQSKVSVDYYGMNYGSNRYDLDESSSSNVSIITLDSDNLSDENIICIDMECVDDEREEQENKEIKDSTSIPEIEESDDCIVLDEDSKTSHQSAITIKKFDIVWPGMRVLALKDKTKHIWDFGTIIRIPDKTIEAESAPVDLSIKNLRKSAVTFLVKFDEPEEGESNNQDIYDSDCNFTEKPLTECLTSNLEPVPEEATDTADNEDVVAFKKRRISNIFKDNPSDLVELDSSCLAFLPLSDTTVPDLNYTKYERISQIMILPVQTRVVAFYKVFIEDDQGNSIYSSEYFCSGTITEAPSSLNKSHYLIFFDNGYTMYTKPKFTYPIFDQFKIPIERLHMDHVQFLNDRLIRFPEQLVTKLHPGDLVDFYFNGQWGSYRLYPLYERIMQRLDEHAKPTCYETYIREKLEEQITVKHGCLAIFASTLFPQIVELISEPVEPLDPKEKKRRKKEKQKERQRLEKQARLAEEKRRKEEEKQRKEDDDDRRLQGVARLLDLDIEDHGTSKSDFVPHACMAGCVTRWEQHIHKVKYVNPLLMPFLHGWRRLVCHQSRNKIQSTRMKRWIKYEAPCGRQLRNTGEVDKYLCMTNSWLTIDQFTFDCAVLTNREYESNACYLNIRDITDGKESVPVSAVNCLDDTRPDQIEYSANRMPLEGVPLDTSGDDLVGCDCIDGCRDRNKCACWRKTFEATEFTPNYYQGGKSTNIGYRGRRLPEIVRSGIFECNPKCKCDCRCSNRVVQNGIAVRMQLFKTHKKGWGLRCLDDIAKGTFICIYAGHLMTEEQSDERGKDMGDEYFAELDFVDIIKKERKPESVCDNSYTHSYNSGNESPEDEPKPEIDYVFLDSDEDEQDVAARDRVAFQSKPSSSSVHLEIEAVKTSQNFNKNRLLSYHAKMRKRNGVIESNRFFTDENNKYYYKRFLDSNNVFIMDAKISGNIGRFFNHSCTPNIYVQNVFIDTYDLRFPWIAFFASENIIAGTELCWDYNYTINSVEGREMFCYCRTRNCRGRLL